MWDLNEYGVIVLLFKFPANSCAESGAFAIVFGAFRQYLRNAFLRARSSITDAGRDSPLVERRKVDLNYVCSDKRSAGTDIISTSVEE